MSLILPWHLWFYCWNYFKKKKKNDYIIYKRFQLLLPSFWRRQLARPATISSPFWKKSRTRLFIFKVKTNTKICLPTWFSAVEIKVKILKFNFDNRKVEFVPDFKTKIGSKMWGIVWKKERRCRRGVIHITRPLSFLVKEKDWFNFGGLFTQIFEFNLPYSTQKWPRLGIIKENHLIIHN